MTIAIPGRSCSSRRRAPTPRSSTSRPRSSKKKGSKALISSNGCKSKKHKIGVTVNYVPNPNPPAAIDGVGHRPTRSARKPPRAPEPSNGPATAGPFSFIDSRACLCSRTGSSGAPICRSRWSLFAAAAAAVLGAVVRRARARLVAAAARRPAAQARCSGCRARSRSCCGAIGVFVFFVVVYAGLFGTDAQSENLAPTAVYVGFWVGIPFASLLFGDVFRLLQPVARDRPRDRLGRASVSRRAAGAAGVPGAARPAARPRLGLLRASRSASCAGPTATEPGPLALLMLVYFVAMLVGHEPVRRRAVGAQRATRSACCSG